MKSLFCVSSGILLNAYLTALALEIPLAVEEPIGVPRTRAPVSSGVCFPRAAVRPDQPFSLRQRDREIPVQVTPLVIDRDGSLRWALLDFQLDAGPRQSQQVVLRTEAPSARSPDRIQVSETDSVVTVNTGPLSFTIHKTKPFTLFDQVRVQGATVVTGGAVDYVEAKTGQRYTAARPQEVVFEYRGPLRITLRLAGTYEGPGDCRLGYITRITAWAGRTDVRLQHILANSNREQVYHANLRTAALTLQHALGPETQAWVGLSNVTATLNQARSVWLHQGKVTRYYGQPIIDASQAGVDEATHCTSADSDGWMAVRHGGKTLLVCDRDFIGDPPRRLAVDRDQLRVEFISTRFNTGRGVPFLSDHLWLYDLSHRVAEVWIDFASDAAELPAQARAARAPLRAFAPGAWYAQCDVLGVGRFGTLEDEQRAYEQWGWKFDPRQLPRSTPAPHAFVRWEDNHYESEADSAEALLLMALRTGQRGYFDQGEAWARYHANLHAWRTDGWRYHDGAIWFPQGGPLGTRPARRPANFKYQSWDKGSGDDRELWHLVQAKACYCHFYGAGLVDYFLLTGERDALEAAVDLAEQKNSEFRKHRQFVPGQTTISDTRGFGRGFYVITHLLEAIPDQAFVADLARLCRDVLWQCPNLDERGFAPCHLGTGFGGFDPKRDLPAPMKKFMEQEGISMDDRGWLTDAAGRRWPVVCLGGTWQHAYIQAAADRYARLFGDEDLADFTEAFGRFAARYLLSEQCKQTWYYAYLDVPIKGKPWDPWQFTAPHTTTRDGDGCEHEGYYTRFFPDAIAMAYSITGDATLLLRAREFWHYGGKRGYRTQHYSAGRDAVGMFANHVPPKDDSVLSTSRLFYEWTHPRRDRQPPATIRDLSVAREENGQARVRFTAPAEVGGGKVARYQVKCAERPIVSYDDYEFARDDGVKRNWWRAANLDGEPTPAVAGAKEEFVVRRVPSARTLYFAVVSFDDSHNRSRLSNVAPAEQANR